MAVTLTTPNTILGALAPKGDTAKLATNLATIVLGTLLLAASAHTSVPVQPVPVTLQTFAVAVLAAAFGWRIAVATVALYIAEGLSGLPVFSTGGGLDYVLRPSFGFILGYLPMAYIIGRAADLGASGKVVRLFAAILIGDAVAFVFGFLWLLAVSGLILRQGGALPGWLNQNDLLTTAFNGAVKPFIIWDILKMAFAALTVTGAWTLLRRKA
ncbi:MAG: biotin transporter BioY [Hyphomicrobiales bacterium]|jgi:biotin transport system substrate-specific component|nr:biotin transporter BioY [Hyphomicrobiales bacterium]